MDKDNKIIELRRQLGVITALELSSIINNLSEAVIYIMHNQAPTTDARDINAIHPYYDEKHKSYTWHNGILKPGFVNSKRPDVKWDTIVLADYLNGAGPLDEIDGSFAFIHLVDGKLQMGRNEICPLYMYYGDNRHFYISSVPVHDRYQPIKAGERFYLHSNGLLVSFDNESFKTHQMPYYLGDDD